MKQTHIRHWLPRCWLPLTAAVVFAGCAHREQPPAAGSTAPDADAELAAFFEAYDQTQLALSPMKKAYRGLRDDDYGRWDDPSDTAAARLVEQDRAALAQMRARFDPKNLKPSSQLSYRLFEDVVARNERALAYRHNVYLFNQMNGQQSRIPAFLINIHRIASAAEAEAYISRLRNIGPLFDTLLDMSARRAARGVVVPGWVFPYVMSDAQNVISGAPFNGSRDSVLLADFKAKLAKLALAEPTRTALIHRAETALVEQVRPAYQRLIAEMQRQQGFQSAADGVWRFDDGAGYYAERLAYYTTTTLSAERIHQIGLDNVERIHDQMRRIMDRVGFDGSLRDFFKYLRSSDHFFFDNRSAYLTRVDERLEAMRAALPRFFDTLPKADLRVKAVEAFREKSAGKAFYQRPAADGSRPGTYYVNLYRLRDMSRIELEALAYHEGLPGHHLQRAIATELGTLPPFRRFGRFTAYSEGWGLYSEELGKDMGFYEDPYSDFGRLGMELWRACRLVVDTGIHHKRWSRAEAIEYLRANTPNPDGDVRKAIERYVVYPGQATAYMIGKLEIMRLRDRAQGILGDGFRMGAFHDVVLRAGPVPLSIMAERIDQWIADSR